MDRENIVYKTLASLMFGYISFYISMSPLTYIIDNQVTSINGGLFIPLLISMAWGWKYGLLCSLFGFGTQYGWWSWYPSGYGAAFGVSTHTLWVMWHGWWRNNYKCRLSKDTRYCWLRPYVGEIIIRSVIVLIYYSAFSLAMSFNPPFWDNIVTTTGVTNLFLNTVMIKQVIEGLLWLTLCDLLLLCNPVRRVLRLAYITSYLPKVKQWVMIIIVILTGIDLIVDQITSTRSYLELIIYPSSHTIVHRVIILTSCTWFGIFLSKYMRQYAELRNSLKNCNRRYSEYFELLPLPIILIDSDRHILQMSKVFRGLLKISNVDHIRLLTKEIRCCDYFKFPICNTDKCVLYHTNKTHYNTEFLVQSNCETTNYCLSVIHTISNEDGTEESLLLYEVERMET